MGEDDLHVGEIHRDIIDQHRLAVFQAHAATAAHAGAHAGVSGVEDRGQAIFGDDFVDRIADAIGRVAVLGDAMELEALHAEVLDQITGLTRAELALVRVD